MDVSDRYDRRDRYDNVKTRHSTGMTRGGWYNDKSSQHAWEYTEYENYSPSCPIVGRHCLKIQPSLFCHQTGKPVTLSFNQNMTKCVIKYTVVKLYQF